MPAVARLLGGALALPHGASAARPRGGRAAPIAAPFAVRNPTERRARRDRDTLPRRLQIVVGKVNVRLEDAAGTPQDIPYVPATARCDPTQGRGPDLRQHRQPAAGP